MFNLLWLIFFFSRFSTFLCDSSIEHLLRVHTRKAMIWPVVKNNNRIKLRSLGIVCFSFNVVIYIFCNVLLVSQEYVY